MEIEKLASLAKIKLNKSEEKQIKKDLDKILDYFKVLDEINVDEIKLNNFSLFQTYNIYRKDIKKESKNSKNLLDNIIFNKNHYIKVKTILKQD